MSPRRPRRPARAAALRRAGIAAGPIAAGLLVCAGGVHQVVAQGLTGSTLTATISQRFEANSNYRLQDPSPGTSYFGDTRLRLGLLSETSTRQFSLGLDTGLRALWEAEQPFEFTYASPSTADVGYSQEWANAFLDTSFRYRQRRFDLDTLEVTFDDFGIPDTIEQINRDATEHRYDAAILLALATDAPSSYTFALDATRFDYSDDDAGQSPSTTLVGSATWDLRLTPVLSTAVVASYYDYDSDDTRETEITVAEIDAGLIFQPDDNLEFGAGLGFADRQRYELRGGRRVQTENEQGPVLRANLSYDFEDFIVVGNIRVTDAAPSTRVMGDLRVDYPLPRGSLNARVFQSYTGDTEGDEVRLTGAGIGAVRDLNSAARFGIDFGVARQENQDDRSEPDIDRLDVGAVFSYDLTEALTADLGYRFRYRDESPETADSHAVFFTIGRTFVTRP
jgi:hypothetical protein